MNWKDKHNLFFKLLRLHFGLALYSIGLTLGIQANIGLAPWEAFGIGVSYVTGLTYGTINVLSGLLILVVTVAMGERFGLGTILNAVLIGFGVDVLQYYHAVPLQNSITCSCACAGYRILEQLFLLYPNLV